MMKKDNFFFTVNDDDEENKSKSFLEITKEDLIKFLDSFRKPEPIDPLHKWIGTYNSYLVIISRFFKWLYYSDLPPKERIKPKVIDNLTQLKRKETSIYKPTDLWTQEDDQLFLKYCPSTRDRCYHTISRDTGCRPHEILGLRIKDVVFKMANDRQYAEVLVNGKTGSRTVPLINSIPYVKDYLDDHPQRTNPNTYLIFGLGKSYGKKLHKAFINQVYKNYKKVFFPRLLEDPKISPEDKVKIIELLKKPWNPYIRRHSALTEKSQILKENVLRQYAGWSMGSNMHLEYLHYFGNESNESILEAYGLKTKSEEIDKMKPKQCPNCSELNKIDSKFCVKCRMILSYDIYLETVQKQENENSYIKEMQKQIDEIYAKIKENDLKNK
jgi:integrase/recombinase XerD